MTMSMGGGDYTRGDEAVSREKHSYCAIQIAPNRCLGQCVDQRPVRSRGTICMGTSGWAFVKVREGRGAISTDSICSGVLTLGKIGLTKVKSLAPPMSDGGKWWSKDHHLVVVKIVKNVDFSLKMLKIGERKL